MKIRTDFSGDLIDLAEHGPQAVILGLMKALITPIRLPGLIIKTAYREYHYTVEKLARIKDYAKCASPIKPWSSQ